MSADADRKYGFLIGHHRFKYRIQTGEQKVKTNFRMGVFAKSSEAGIC